MQLSNEQQLGQEPVGRLMLKMGIPTLIAQLINLLYSIVDRIYIGHIADIGATALTAIGLTTPVILLITAFSAIVGQGGAPQAAIALGKGDRERADSILSNGLTLLLIFSACLMAVFYVFKKPFLYFVGASDTTWPYANQYLSIYLAGTLFVQLTMGLNSFITAQGCSSTAMLSVLIGAVINIVLDPILIFGLKLGVRGAAIATVLSQLVSALWVLRFLIQKAPSIRIRRKKLRLSRGVVGAIVSLGISPFVMQSTESLIALVFSSGLAAYGGDLYVGSLTILQSVMQLISIPVYGFSAGIQPIISYNFGAKHFDRVRTAFRLLLVILTCVSAAIALAAILAPGMFARIFTNDAALIALVEQVLPIFMFGMLIFGVQNACQISFISLGQAKISLFIALLRKVILLVPLALLLPRITQSVLGIYYAEPIADILSAVTCGTLFFIRFPRILRAADEAVEK